MIENTFAQETILKKIEEKAGDQNLLYYYDDGYGDDYGDSNGDWTS